MSLALQLTLKQGAAASCDLCPSVVAASLLSKARQFLTLSQFVSSGVVLAVVVMDQR